MDHTRFLPADSNSNRGVVAFPSARGYRMPCFVVLLFLSAPIGRNTLVYHDLLDEELRVSGMVVALHLDEINWLTSVSGDSSRLARRTSDSAKLRFFRDFEPSDSNWYYVLVAGAEDELLTGVSPTVFRHKIWFDSLIISNGERETTIDLDQMLQRSWEQSGSIYTSVEPIPIPADAREVILRATILVADFKNCGRQDTLHLSVGIERKKEVRSFLEPWP